MGCGLSTNKLLKMKNKKLIIALVISAAVLIASIFISSYLFSSFENVLRTDPTIQYNSQLSNSSYFSLYLQCFLILFASISLPYLFSVFALKWNINESNWWKPILVLELVGLLLAYLTTPPDLFSTILIFIIWQIPVVINLITLNVKVRSMKK